MKFFQFFEISNEISNQVKKQKFFLSFSGLLPQTKIFFLLWVILKTNKNIFFLTSKSSDLQQVFQEAKTLFRFFAPHLKIKIFPGFEVVPGFEELSDPITTAQSFELLEFLKNKTKNMGHPLAREKFNNCALIASTVKSCLFRVPLPEKSCFLCIKKGTSLNYDDFLESLVAFGYQAVTLVEEPGQFSKRGGIVDVFPGNQEKPLRIEFSGNKIFSLRIFDVRTQISEKQVESAKIFAVKVSSSKNSFSFFDFLGSEDIVIVDEPFEVKSTCEQIFFESKELKKNFFTNSAEKFIEKVFEHQKILQFFQFQPEVKETITFEFSPAPEFNGQIEKIRNFFGQRLENLGKIIIVTRLTQRVQEILEKNSQNKNLLLIPGDLSSGFNFSFSSLSVFSDKELFGFSRNLKEPLLVSAHPGALPEQKVDWREGDYLVHLNYGIGIYRGLKKIKITGVENEYIFLEYADGDKLFVPSYQLELVEKYSGLGKKPRLSHLSGRHWQRLKLKTKSYTDGLAQKLYFLYERRKKSTGFAFPPDNEWQKEMEEGFPYEGTPHQLAAISAVKKDMESNYPMERLLLGDVGYGKTEVALRAAFKAAIAGKQVAMLAPTTILVEQHYENFVNRLKAFPVKVEMLSRFKKSREQKEIIKGIANGSVDIVIGTHRLLGKDVNFKDLGLLIIDEEQRFGVVHKEKIKALKTGIDVLLLSATPIPRTFYMAISGISDLSLMTTPPEDRLPVKTKVSVFNPHLIKEAIIFELERDGQVFYVHNRIQTIYHIAEFLKKLVPALKIGIIHGKLEEEEIERVMAEFKLRKTNLLLATSIIENGLDLPNVNTLIVDNAEKFGLADLYQLRGRVGRSNRQAFAYFFFNPSLILTAPARARLQAIKDFANLGDSYKIALKDLEIRGAGTLFGREQHGHIADVGFSLYCKLLSDSVREIKGELVEPDFEPELKLGVSAYLPKDYIAEEDLRLGQYQRLLRVKNLEDLEKMQNEFYDRFGPLPEVVRNLMEIIKIKFLVKALKFKKIERKDNQVICYFGPIKFKEKENLINVAKEKIKNFFPVEEGLVFKLSKTSDIEFLKELREILKILQM